MKISVLDPVSPNPPGDPLEGHFFSEQIFPGPDPAGGGNRTPSPHSVTGD